MLQRLVLVLDSAELQPEPRVLRLRLLPQLQQVIVDHRQLPQQIISALVPQIDPSVPQPVVQSRRRPLLGPSPG